TIDSTKTNEMVDQAKQEPKTMVWWDINSCPVPDGYDASMVAQSIELALKKAGHTGPLTITAIGYLNYTLKQMPDGMSSGETRRQKQCCETAWLCSMCKNSCPLTEGDGSFQGKSFEDFTSHLKSEYHALCELSMVSRPISKKLANLTECSNKKSSKRSIEEEEEEEEEDQYWEDEEWERLTV
ncbi:hypothetical protein CARUB_v10007438mg, partial [Capsella rubella]